MALEKDQKILFKQGTQEKFDSLKTSIPGAFYLTTDTHRLYIGDDAGKQPVPINQGLVKVATQDLLPTVEANDEARYSGQFYLIENGNILCIRSQGKWVQINTDTTLSSFGQTVVKDEENKKVIISSSVTDTAGNEDSDSFELIEGAGVTITVNGNSIAIASNGAGGAEVKFTVAGSEDSKTATVTGKTTVTAADGTVTNSESSYALKAGDKIKSVVADEAAGSITINAETQEVTSIGFAVPTEDKEGFILNLAQTSGNDLVSTPKLNPEIKIGKDGEETSVKFVDNIADLDVYTIAQTDAKVEEEIQKSLKAADAMVFKGTVGAGGTVEALPAITEASNGDTYKVVSELSNLSGITGGSSVKVGDLLIAMGEEDEATGLLTSGSFVLVPSGNEYQVVSKFLTHGIKFTNDAETPDEIGGIQLEEGQNIVLTDKEVDKTRVVIIDHETIATTTPDAAASTEYANEVGKNGQTKTVTVVTGLTVENGHVTNIATATEEFKNSALETATVVTEANETQARSVDVTLNITDTLGAELTPVVNIDSETLTLEATAEGLKADLLWGEF